MNKNSDTNRDKQSLLYHERNKFVGALLKGPEHRTDEELTMLAHKFKNLDFFKKFLEDNDFDDLKDLVKHCYYE